MTKAKSDIKNIHQRIAEAMEVVTYIKKDKKQGMQYAVVSHDVVTAKVRPALLKAGVHYYPQNMKVVQVGNRTEMTLDVRFVNIEKPDDFIDVPSCGYGIDSQDKGPGKAESYAVKMALLKAMGLETGEDPDLDQNVKHEQEQEQESPEPKQPNFGSAKQPTPEEWAYTFKNGIHQMATLDLLIAHWQGEADQLRAVEKSHPDIFKELVKAKDDKKAFLENPGNA